MKKQTTRAVARWPLERKTRPTSDFLQTDPLGPWALSLTFPRADPETEPWDAPAPAWHRRNPSTAKR